MIGNIGSKSPYSSLTFCKSRASSVVSIPHVFSALYSLINAGGEPGDENCDPECTGEEELERKGPGRNEGFSTNPG